ncbi:MAG: J domain-containing protein [candidate division WOR-3 bacterium]|nr:J domain-containing protein [candidate division WOR-3 bacterium]
MKNALDTTFDHKDPYRIIGVTADATPVAIRKAYLELAKRNHQDLFATDPEKYRSSTVLMQDINSAYELLSDPTRRELWNRRHPGAPRKAPQQPSRPTPEPTAHYESKQTHIIIKKYNGFVGSLRTPAERQKAARKIGKFQSSREGTAYIRKLVASYYEQVIDLLNLGGRISVYDDGLVELMFLYAGVLEVDPSKVFVTYAYLLHRENRGKVPPAPGTGKPPRRSPGPGDSRVSLLRLRHDPRPTRPAAGRDLGTRIRDWLRS